MKVLTQRQRKRDLELSLYLDLPLDIVASWMPGSSDSKLILDKKSRVLGAGGRVDEQKVIDLYRFYKYMDVRKYLKTLMYTTIARRPQSLFKLMRGLRSGHILDYGAGVGTHAIALLENGCTVDLLDVKGPLRDFAEWRLKHRKMTGWRILDHDAELKPGSYQYVICVDMLEHVLHPVKILIRILNALEIGGTLYLLMARPRLTTGHLKETWDEWVKKGRGLLRKRCKNPTESIYIKER